MFASMPKIRILASFLEGYTASQWIYTEVHHISRRRRWIFRHKHPWLTRSDTSNPNLTTGFSRNRGMLLPGFFLAFPPLRLANGGARIWLMAPPEIFDSKLDTRRRIRDLQSLLENKTWLDLVRSFYYLGFMVRHRLKENGNGWRETLPPSQRGENGIGRLPLVSASPTQSAADVVHDGIKEFTTKGYCDDKSTEVSYWRKSLTTAHRKSGMEVVSKNNHSEVEGVVDEDILQVLSKYLVGWCENFTKIGDIASQMQAKGLTRFLLMRAAGNLVLMIFEDSASLRNKWGKILAIDESCQFLSSFDLAKIQILTKAHERIDEYLELKSSITWCIQDFSPECSTRECNIEEVADDEGGSSKSSKDKKGTVPEKYPSLIFKITSRIPYKTVLKAHSAVVLKAESIADKIEWLEKLKTVVESKGGQVKVESRPPMRQSLSDGSLDTMARKPADPEEELRWMSQEVRGYVEAVLNSLAANVPKAVVLCLVEKAKEDMLIQLYSSVSAISDRRIEELLMEDQNAKRRRERYQKQSSLLSKLTRQLSIHDNRAAAVSSWSNDSAAESSTRASGASPGDDWRNAFDAAANGPIGSGRYLLNGHSRRYSDPEQDGDEGSGSRSSSSRTPTRLPPAPPQSGSSYRY
ncbi:Dynamin-2A [Hibiscus syriacus]|uniref:Dynamin-2A n=1 Tax=Hibiscus syriacus TaxID=106335 RepID=A0A6A3CJG3_HIBSY|nr:Dynamin-2A [Hibiscus syriacus]